MIRDIVTEISIPKYMDIPAVLLFCLLINAWAAVTAHLIGRGWSKEIQDWERWNFIFIKNRSQSPQNIVSDEMRREIIRARFWAVFSGVILLGLVATIIYYRIIVKGAESTSSDFDNIAVNNKDMSTGLSMILAYLPVAIILGELLTGDYFWYSIRRLQKKRRRNINRNHFLKNKERCGVSDQLAVQYTQAAQQKNESIQIIGDLEKSHLRIKYRSQQNDTYLDALDEFRRIGFTFKFRGSGKPIVGVNIFGMLPNGAKTGDYPTDEQGKATIHLDANFQYLVAVSILGKEFLGPFQSYGEHYIDLPEPIMEHVTSNGVS
jgi:hypothetical protein